ncbi:MAG: DUF5009 domain-containing protein [Chitinophagaceae bacterium]|nr:DUF5009 domain-containing protein [Chitinophagaceae bacterium]
MKALNSKQSSEKMHRLQSVDVLRGFDMFWIMGAGDFIVQMAGIQKTPFWTKLATQFDHPYWNGFAFWDLIFPLFMFLSGISSVFSIDVQLKKGNSRNEILTRVMKRGLILILLGIFYNNGLNIKPLAEIRFPSVLGKIGLSYIFASIIYLYAKEKTQIIWFWSLLIGYWCLLKFTSAPGFPMGNLTEPGNFMSYFDRTFLPGKLSRNIHDTSGFLCTITGIATTLSGILTGNFLKKENISSAKKAGWFVIAGVASILLALLWNFNFPINKNLWSSSFVLLTTGLSLLLLALFYYVIDVKGYSKWSFFFRVIGMNSIFIYISPKIIHYGYFAEGLFGWCADLFGVYQPAVVLLFVIITEWLVLYFMYRKNIFIRI